MNSGKRWEQNFSKGNPYLIRLYDTTNGFAGVKNPCDFIYYKYPLLFPFELKSTKRNTFNLNMLTENQAEQLKNMNNVKGCFPYLCVEFSENQECYAIWYGLIEDLKLNGLKSLSVSECRKHWEKYGMFSSIIEIPTIYKKVNCDIDWEAFNLRLLTVHGVM